MANPRAGKVLQGRYRLRSILAEGGMGVVWQAERVGIERPVVVKFLQAVLSDRPGAVDRFEREARATARLNHPNCVQLVDYGLDEGQPYLVVEFVEGQTLAGLLEHGPLDARRATRIAVQVLAGLEHAHERGILHRDMKPANLMIVEATGYEDFVKILDFGLAKIIDETDRREVTVHGVALGTPGYMSPEQAAGMPSDLRADLYSVGAVLYHLITGIKMFEGGNVHSILRKHREDTPAPPRRLRGPGAISAELDAVVSRALQRDAERRYQNAAEMRRALEATPEGAIRSRPRRASAPEEDAAPRETQRRRVPPRPVPGTSWAVAIALCGATALTGAGVAYALLRAASGGGPPMIAGEGDGGIAVISLGSPGTARVEVLPLADMARPPDLAVKVTALPAPKPGVPVTTPIAPAPGATDVGGLASPPSAGDDRLDDGSSEDLRTPPPPPPEAPHRDTREIRTIGDVRGAVRRGETDLAISGLYKLRRRPNQSAETQAEIATVLGHLYYDRHWTTEALREYRYALSLDLRARTDPTIINNTVRALGDRTNTARARRVLVDFVGRTAIPALRRAAERPDTRRVAEEVLAKLGAARR
jgi:serine/threonine-protein kinase